MRCLSNTRVMLVSGIILFLVVRELVAAPIQAQAEQRCFAETGYCISGPIRSFYEQHGDITVFGLPISPQQDEYIGLLTST